MNIRTFVAESAILFSENEGGSKAVWDFSENSSVLELSGIPTDWFRFLQPYINELCTFILSLMHVCCVSSVIFV